MRPENKKESVTDNENVVVLGTGGLVGGAIARKLPHATWVRGREDCDLTKAYAVDDLMVDLQPDVVIHAAGNVGGIWKNIDDLAGDMYYDNLVMGVNVMRACETYDVGKVINIGTSCMYPINAIQPYKEEDLKPGLLEPTNQGYALAKLAVAEMAKAIDAKPDTGKYVTVIPPNVYGPGDNFDPVTGHVMAGMIHRICLAKMNKSETVSLYNSGWVQREFIHCDDLADGIINVIDHYEDTLPINVGPGWDHNLWNVAMMIAGVVGWHGRFTDNDFSGKDTSGAKRKLMDCTKYQSMFGDHIKDASMSSHLTRLILGKEPYEL